MTDQERIDALEARIEKLEQLTMSLHKYGPSPEWRGWPLPRKTDPKLLQDLIDGMIEGIKKEEPKS